MVRRWTPEGLSSATCVSSSRDRVGNQLEALARPMSSEELLGRHRSRSDLRGRGIVLWLAGCSRGGTRRPVGFRLRLQRAEASIPTRARHRSRESRCLDRTSPSPEGRVASAIECCVLSEQPPPRAKAPSMLRRARRALDEPRAAPRGFDAHTGRLTAHKRADRRGAARTGHPLFEPHLERRAHSPAPKSSLAAWALGMSSRAASPISPSSQAPKNEGVRRIRWRARSEFSAVEK